MVLDPGAFPTPTYTADARSTKMPQPTSGPSAGPPATHPPDRLIIPAIDLDSSVIAVGWHTIEENGSQYSVWEVVDKVVGWHKTSAYPGHSGNVVLNGHHNIRGEVFRHLVDLEIGDTILVYVKDQVYYYAVEAKHILKEKGESIEVRRKNAAWIAPTSEEQLTMVTCWPYTNNTHRLVVVAKPAPAPESTGLAE
jgi:sortase A